MHTILLLVEAADINIDGNTDVSTLEAVIGNIILVSVVLAAILGIWKAVSATRKTLKKVDQFFDDWQGEAARDGFAARPGILQRLQQLEYSRVETSDMLTGLSEQIKILSDHVNAELNRNGGGSTKDAAHEALRVAKEIQLRQEIDSKNQHDWHMSYIRDQARARGEWDLFMTTIDTMLPLPLEEQQRLWRQVTHAYAEGTLNALLERSTSQESPVQPKEHKSSTDPVT